jgi:hypothetical protein
MYFLLFGKDFKKIGSNYQKSCLNKFDYDIIVSKEKEKDMRKFLLILTICFVFSSLIGCQDAEEQIIVFSDLEGQGTDNAPYQIKILKEETKSFSFTAPKSLLGNLKAYEAEKTSIGYLELLDSDPHGLEITVNGTSLELKGIAYGKHYVKIASGAVYVILEVEVERGVMDFSKTFKVLAIGNSFSEDGMEYLYKIAKDFGVEEIVLGNMHRDGASLEMHVTSFTNNASNYKYKKNTNDSWVKTEGHKLLYGLQDEDWDIIVIQQVSGSSGRPNTYDPYLNQLIDFVKANITNPYARIYWHMTWAYANTSNHNDFYHYNRDQMTMYEAIVDTVNELIVPHQDIYGIIPSGTTIQNMRTSFLGDTLNVSDGYHLNVKKGRYAAALTWFKAISGLTIDDITYRTDDMDETVLALTKEAVNNAVSFPFQVTESTYKTK